ncbi:outer membrane protein assembly factor BamB family protein [Halosegnis longus]|uniref:outer membrane protein assembly factor BamB family protein n=1 Tax=Halosegnis longus TaxID=2216012 RepID=UPI001F413C52|nr:PQQ-binding-like beta-propeller repeat protein [Halosegnis longus]
MYNPTHRVPRSRKHGPDSDPSVRWSHQLQKYVHEVAIWDNTVYVAVSDEVVAIGTDGTEQWSFRTDDEVWSSPAVVDGTVYVGSDDAHVYALDARSGTEQWSFRTDGEVRSSPAVVDDTVYVGSGYSAQVSSPPFDRGTVYALDAASGTERWTFQTANDPVSGVSSSPAVVDGTVYVGSDDAHVYALDARSGTEQWSFQTANAPSSVVRSSPAVVDGTVYIGSRDTHVYALDARSGTEQWSFQTDGWVRSSPAVVDDTVYVGSDDTRVYALDARGGTEQWSFRTDGEVRSSPAVVDDTVYIGNVDRHVYALDAASGTEQWSFQTDGTTISPVVVDGTVYVGSCDRVYALGEEESGGNTKVYERCSGCGADLSDHGDVNFCPKCGAQTETSADSNS